MVVSRLCLRVSLPRRRMANHCRRRYRSSINVASMALPREAKNHEWSRRWFVLLTVCALLLSPVTLPEQRTMRPLFLSTFKRLALAVSKAPTAVRAEFAAAAVSEMVLAFGNEADRARQDVRDKAPGRSPARWAAAVDGYAATLTTILHDTASDTPVDISIGTENDVALTINGTPVMVSFPQTVQQAVFEQRVVDRFCSRYRCEELIADYQAVNPPPSIHAAPPRWSFSGQAGPVCATDDGLAFQFRDTLMLTQKRKACDRIIAELNALAIALAENRAAGIPIDWNQLSIRTLPGEDQHYVELDSAGGYIRMPLPGLASTARLFELVRPWLAAKVKGNSIQQVVINADRLMAPLLQ